MNSIFYGSIYDDEKKNYRKIVENQFYNCSKDAKEKGLNIVKWGFDVIVEDDRYAGKDIVTKEEIEKFVKKCAKKYFPGVESV